MRIFGTDVEREEIPGVILVIVLLMLPTKVGLCVSKGLLALADKLERRGQSGQTDGSQ